MGGEGCCPLNSVEAGLPQGVVGCPPKPLVIGATWAAHGGMVILEAVRSAGDGLHPPGECHIVEAFCELSTSSGLL